MKAKKKKAPPKVMVQASAQTSPPEAEKPIKEVFKVETAVQVQSFVEEEKKEPEKPQLRTSASQVSPRKIGSYEL